MHAVTFLALALALAPAAPALKEKPPKASPLVGRWECTRLVSEGVESPQAKGLEYEFTAAGEWLIYRDGKPVPGFDGKARTYRLDPTVGPGVIDLREKEAPYAGMYRAARDELTLSMRTSGAGRPDDPGAAGKGLLTFTFKRVARKD